MNPTTYAVPLANAKRWNIGESLVINGGRFLIVAVDDSISTLFVRPTGKRKERRESVRKAFA